MQSVLQTASRQKQNKVGGPVNEKEIISMCCIVVINVKKFYFFRKAKGIMEMQLKTRLTKILNELNKLNSE